MRNRGIAADDQIEIDHYGRCIHKRIGPAVEITTEYFDFNIAWQIIQLIQPVFVLETYQSNLRNAGERGKLRQGNEPGSLKRLWIALPSDADFEAVFADAAL